MPGIWCVTFWYILPACYHRVFAFCTTFFTEYTPCYGGDHESEKRRHSQRGNMNTAFSVIDFCSFEPALFSQGRRNLVTLWDTEFGVDIIKIHTCLHHRWNGLFTLLLSRPGAENKKKSKYLSREMQNPQGKCACFCVLWGTRYRSYRRCLQRFWKNKNNFEKNLNFQAKPSQCIAKYRSRQIKVNRTFCMHSHMTKHVFVFFLYKI